MWLGHKLNCFHFLIPQANPAPDQPVKIEHSIMTPAYPESVSLYQQKAVLILHEQLIQFTDNNFMLSIFNTFSNSDYAVSRPIHVQ
jgi:hypothetical protein